MSKRIAILGSTGSIGCSTLDVIRHLGPPYRAVALGAYRQVEKLAAQVKEFSPQAVALADESGVDRLKHLLGPGGPRIFSGENGMAELARHDEVDIVIAAVVGAAGLPAALAAVRAGKTLALANKEALVVAGSLLIPEARGAGWRCFPLIPSIRPFSRRWPVAERAKSDGSFSPPAADPSAIGRWKKSATQPPPTH